MVAAGRTGGLDLLVTDAGGAFGGGVDGAGICVDGARDHPGAGRFFPWAPPVEGPCEHARGPGDRMIAG
ncbi:hypothetical protein, partial [Streptomyces sp. NPDC056045]|uniref:hypothetical protein n=1 Tax=Streptomyces sp. NPDC056045 TaxID=3345691 RepID=UPI0035D58A37